MFFPQYFPVFFPYSSCCIRAFIDLMYLGKMIQSPGVCKQNHKEAAIICFFIFIVDRKQSEAINCIRSQAISIIIFFLFFLYFYFLRPHVQPFSLIFFLFSSIFFASTGIALFFHLCINQSQFSNFIQ